MVERLLERDLIHQVADGDQVAYRTVVRDHRDRVFRLALRLTGDPQKAEDVLQETFLAVWRSASSYSGEASVRAWVCGIARRQAWRTLRKRAGEDLVPLTELGCAAGWGQRSPEELAAASEDVERLRVALMRLDAEDREVIALRDLEQLSGPETAHLLGISLAAQKSRLHRARLRLMAQLVQGGAHAA